MIPFEYRELKAFENGIARAKKEDYWGYINTKGEVVIPFEYSELKAFENGIARAEKDEYWGYINTKGEVVIPFEYRELKAFENGIARAEKDEYWGYINTKGEVVIPFEYRELDEFKDGIAKAMNNDGKWGYIDTKGNPISESIEEVTSGVFRAKQFEKWGLQDEAGNVIFPFEYSELKAFENGIARAKKDGYWGYINTKGEVVIPFEYRELKSFKNGIAKAKNNDGKWGYIDTKGNPISESVEKVANGIFRAKQFGKWGLQDTDGKIVCPFIYDEIIAYQGGYITYKGKFRSDNNQRAKGIFRYVKHPSIEAQVVEAVVVNTAPYGIFVSIRNMPATLIHKNALSQAGLSSTFSIGSKLNVIATGVNQKYRVINVKLVPDVENSMASLDSFQKD